MEALCNDQSKKLYSLLNTGSTYYRWTGKRRDMTTKMMTAMLNIKTNKQNQLKSQKRPSSLNFSAIVCVYWYTGLSLA